MTRKAITLNEAMTEAMTMPHAIALDFKQLCAIQGSMEGGIPTSSTGRHPRNWGNSPNRRGRVSLLGVLHQTLVLLHHIRHITLGLRVGRNDIATLADRHGSRVVGSQRQRDVVPEQGRDLLGE